MVSILSLVIATAAFTGCKRVNGKGEVQTRTYDLSGFTKVDLSNQGDVVLVTDANQFVEVKTHENLFDAISLEVKDGRLKIKNKPGYSIGKYDELTYYVHAPSLTNVSVSGSGTITGDNGIAASNFNMDVSGSGDIRISGINSESIDADISGSGSIVLNGAANQSDLSISGSGNIKAFGLVSKKTEAKISGSGNIETTTTENLDVRISGSGNVRYKGQPVINTHMSGSGNLTNAN